MDFIYGTWWLWLVLTATAFACSPRTKRYRALCEVTLGVAGIMFILSVVLHFFPR